ncbi:MAG: DUF2628 domain-containing protein [Alphaproteobacteria bacterium]|nr:DUF2628 domain-containing protein [Alphaproteobacteria bacterium]
MRLYTVHIDPVDVSADRGAMFIKEGFSWPAALFRPLWAVYHKLWLTALGLAVIETGLGLGLAFWVEDALLTAVVALGYLALLGAHANDWHRLLLERRGCRLVTVIAGRDRVAAETRFFAAAAHQVAVR